MADTNHNIYLTLNFPGYDNEKFREKLRAVRFTCEEEINRPYTLKILFYIPGDAKPDDDSVFLEQAVALRVINHTVGKDYDNESMAGQNLPSAATGKYADASRRTFYGRVTECEHLGIFSSGDDEYHFYQILVQPNFHNTRFTSTIRTYMRPMEGDDRLTYKDVLRKAIDKYNANLDQSYYIDKLTNGSVSKKDRFPVTTNFDNVKTDEDDTALNPEFAVQYNESYYNFILRTLERQGWYYYFDFVAPKPDQNEDPAELNPADLEYEPEIMRFQSRQTVERLGVKTTQFLDFAKRTDSGLGIISKYEKRTAPITQVTVLGYDPDTPKKSRAAVYPESDTSNNPNSIVVPDNYFEDETEGKKLAQIRYEEYQCRERTFRIKANIPGAAPGLTFVLRSEANVDEDSAGDLSEVWTADNSETMKYFIAAARHRGTSGAIEPFVMEILKDGDLTGEPTVPGYFVEMDCVPNRGVFRPQRSLPWSELAGTVLATTLQVDTATGTYAAALEDNTYFIKFKGGCTALTDTGQTSSDLKYYEDGSVGPIRLQSPMATGGAGVSTYINAGSEVLVSFQEGDPNRPVILGPIPNADTVRDIYLNAVETKLETGLATRMIQDTGSGNSSTDTGIGDSSTTSLDFQAGMSFSNETPTFSTSSALTMRSHSAALNSSTGTFYNSLGAVAGVGVPTIFTVLSESKKLGVSINKAVVEKNKKKVNIPTLTMALNKMPTINGLLQTFMAIGGMQMQGHRVAVSAMPEVANVNVRSQPNCLSSKIINPLVIILKFLNDLDAFRLGIKENHELAKKNQEAMEKREEARKNEENNENGGDGEGKKEDEIDETDYYSSLGYLITSNALDITAMVLEVWIIVKLIVSSSKGALGNKGILLKASAGEVSSGKGFVQQIKSLGSGMTWSKLIPKGTYDDKKGMEINMEADGNIKAVSGGTITIEAYKGAATLPPTAGASGNPKASLVLTQDSASPSIDMQSHKILIEGKEELLLRSDSWAEIGTPSSYVCFLPDITSLHADKFMDVASDHSMTLVSDQTTYYQAKSHIFNLTGDAGGLLMAHYNAQSNQKIAGTPYISIGDDPQATLNMAKAATEFFTAKSNWISATNDYRSASAEYSQELDDQLTILSDIEAVLADTTIKKTAEKTTKLTELAAKSTAKQLSIETKHTALRAAISARETTEGIALEKALAVNSAQDKITAHNVLLGNGADNAKQEIKVSGTDISISSLGTNGKVSIEAEKTIQIKLGKVTFTMTTTSLELKHGSLPLTVKQNCIELA